MTAIRIFLRVSLILLLLLVVGLGALAVYLPRLARSPAVRERIEAAARDATGREFRYAELDIGLVPPRVVVRDPVIAGPSREAPPFAEARSVGLELAVAPLFARAIVVDSLRIEGGTLRMLRTEDGFQFPRPPEKPKAPKKPKPEGEREKSDDSGGFEFAVRSLTLKGTRVIVEDTSVSPHVTWDLSEVDASARGRSLDDPVDFSLAGALASGGRLKGEGRVGAGGRLEVDLALDAVQVAPAVPYLGRGQKVSGGVTGSVRILRGGKGEESLGAELVLDDGEIDMENVRVRGRLSADLDLRGPDFSGPFRIDATHAELRTEEPVLFTKPPGTPATAEGRLVPRGDGRLDFDDVQVEIKNVDAHGKISTGAGVVAALSVAPFELDGWQELLPALEGASLAGRLAAPELRIATQPVDVKGRIAVERLRAAPPRSPPVELRGALLGRGRSLELEDVVVTTAGQAVALSGGIDGLDGAPRLRLGARGRGLDSRALALAYTEQDVIEGPLDLDADLATPLGRDVPLVETLTGKVGVRVGQGRIRGVSLLRQTFQSLGALAETAVLVNRARGSDKLEPFYEDRFESISGTFHVARGVARSDDLRLVYRHYTAQLRGSVGLADGALDMTGDLIVGEKLDAALAGGEAASGRTSVIPLARVRGTVEKPRVDISSNAATSIAARYTFHRKRSKLESEVDERLGEGTGKAVTDILENILTPREK